MKSLQRNKQLYYYALYLGTTRIKDSSGNYTGEREISYGNVTPAKDNISASKGTAIDEIFGVGLEYTKTITTTTDRGIDEYSAIWIVDDELDEIVDSSHTQGDLGLYNGKIYECIETYTGAFNSQYWSEYAQNYKVVMVAKSLNSIVYAIKKVSN